jgi:hypothetical protein
MLTDYGFCTLESLKLSSCALLRQPNGKQPVRISMHNLVTYFWSDFVSIKGHGIELALLFLEVDQYTFRSGYHKEFVWKRLKKLPLSTEAQDRLEKVGLMYLQKRVHFEFWSMVNFMRLRGSPRFWQNVEILAKTGAGGVGRKARWILLARNNAPVRRWIRSELSQARYEPGYVPRLDFCSD